MTGPATSRGAVLRRVAALAQRLPLESAEAICKSLEKVPRETAGASIGMALTGIHEPSVRTELEDLIQKWKADHPGASSSEFAQLLRGAAHANQAYREGQNLEIVWTGPTPPNGAFRRTEQALLEVIDGARETLWIVSFASYKVPSISAALVAAARRGVRINLVLESKEESDGKLTFSALKGLGAELGKSAAVFMWPRDRRPRDASGAQGALHAKCAVADGELLFVSSANLTEYAMKLNMEMGLLIRGTALPLRVARHLSWLVESGTLQLTAPG